MRGQGRLSILNVEEDDDDDEEEDDEVNLRGLYILLSVPTRSMSRDFSLTNEVEKS